MKLMIVVVELGSAFPCIDESVFGSIMLSTLKPLFILTFAVIEVNPSEI